MRRYAPIVAALVLSLIGIAAAAEPPKIVSTKPDNGEVDVSPDLTEIRVRFDRPMDTSDWALPRGGDSAPEQSGEARWLNDRTFVFPVSLKPDHQYEINVNSDTAKGFRSARGQPAAWYPISFKTRAAGASAAKPDTTVNANKKALAALQTAIDNDYSYRDLKKIDWDKEIDERRKEFENSKNKNEFARHAAHLLRLADDGHVSVEADGVRIDTWASSTPPNFAFESMKLAVPHWKEQKGGVITGRFDDGDVGYICTTGCNDQATEAFEKALEQLMDTKALIIDARANGGGDEPAAQRIAGRFVDKPAVYSRARVRHDGRWTKAVDRVVEPQPGAKVYAKPLLVLIGSKTYSSAESFVLMLRCGAKAKLIGATTGGGSGNPKPHALGNGVTVYLSCWEDQLPDGEVLEGRGVRPEISVKTSQADLENSDPIIEAALQYLRTAKAK